MKFFKHTLIVLSSLISLIGCSAETKLSYEECLELANARVVKGEFDKAIDLYNKAASIRPNEVAPHLALGSLYNQVWEKSYSEAYSKYKEGLGRGAKSTLDLNRELEKNGLKNQYKELAVGEYRKVVSIEPSNLEARKYLALFYLNNKQYGNAIQEYTCILQYDNKSSLVYWHLADAFLRVGDYVHAIENIENAYRIEKKHDYYLYRLGQVYFKMKSYDKAFDILTTLRNENSIFYDRLVEYKISIGM